MSDKKTRGLSIAKKMTIFGTVVFVVLLISTIIKYSITKTADHNFDIYTSKAVAGKIYVLEIGKDLNYISRSTRDIMLGNDYEKNIEKIQKSRNSIVQGFKKLKGTMIGTPKEKQKLAHLKEAKKKVLAFIDDGFNKMKSLNSVEQTPKTLALMYQAYKKDATPLANESRKAFAKIVKYKNKGLEKRTKMYHAEMQNLERYMIIEFVVLLVLIVGYLAVLTKSITASLAAFKHGLISFFNFVNGQSKEVNAIVIKSKDEFGMMANVINENIERTKNALAEEKELIDEASVVISRVQHGWYSQLITRTSENEGLNAFRNGINDMIKATKAHFNTINESLETYANYDYTKALVVKDIESGGVFELLVKDINKLRDAINTMLQDNKRTGLSLNGSAQVLLQNVNELNTNSNTAASSLEETAAALDEITSNVANSTEKIMEMSSLANEVTNSAKEGEKLATQTTVSMDEINTQVESINEAISVIDQIAFQTNILSLNAAVEAATAGEAGKGFAVVAGEVRNLASRSAEAAKEIKELVENATQKANEGKNISDKMISGYESLNDNIKKTIDLIADVSSSSKEQQQGIVQINDAINNLDSQTQANASIATQTNEIAKETSAMAQEIVSSADEKEFEGKNDIKA